MKRKLFILIFLIFGSRALFSEEYGSIYKCSFAGKNQFNSIGVIFDYPMPNSESKWFLSQMVGYAFNHNYPIGIEAEYFLGKHFKSEKFTNKFGGSCGVISLVDMGNNKELVYIDALYGLNYVVSQETYEPVYIGFMLKGGAGYLNENEAVRICPVISCSVAIGLLF